MEKKARVQRLSRRDDVKRSWAAAYEEFEAVETDRRQETEPPPSEPPQEIPTPEAKS
jgi:hypothetical protein